MDKLISLQAAIAAVHKNYDTILDFTSDGQTISSSIEDILSELPSAEPEQQWHPVTETPPLLDDLMLKVHDRRYCLDTFNYYVMGFFDGSEFQTYLFRHQDDHDIEIVGWQLCPWKGEE